MFCRLAALVLTMGLFTSCAVSLAGQARPLTSVATQEGEVLIPVASAPLGQKDADAVTEVTKHLAAVRQDGWTAMQGRGTLTHGSHEGDGTDATLSNRNGAEYRLDTQTGTEETSIRIQSTNGKIKDSDGTFSVIPSETAALGLFPFERLRQADLQSSSTSLLDRGMVTIGGTQLRRITYEFAGTVNDPVTHASKAIPIDFYFDPSTHLLIKSVASGQMSGAGSATFLFVVSYGDYRSVAGSIIPFRFSETVNGEPYRTLQLSDVQLSPTFDATYFQF